MTCEISRSDALQCADELVHAAERMREHVARCLPLMEERQLLLVGGEMNSWLRFAREVERLSHGCRESAEEFQRKALRHS